VGTTGVSVAKARAKTSADDEVIEPAIAAVDAEDDEDVDDDDLDEGALVDEDDIDPEVFDPEAVDAVDLVATDTGEVVPDANVTSLETLEEEEAEAEDDLVVDELIVRVIEDDDDDEAQVEAVREGEEFVCMNCFLVKNITLLADTKRQFCRDCA